MTDTRLLLDLGNSRLKWVWAAGEEVDTDNAGQGDLRAFADACAAGGVSAPGAVLLSSVAGAERTATVCAACRDRWGIEPRTLTTLGEQGGVRNGYHDPAMLGVDRWLAIVGAAARYGVPVVIWDLGTASTLDAVDAAGQHLGGLILPGPLTMLQSLAEKTRLQVPPDFGEEVGLGPGRSTSECIRRGVLAAQHGALQQFLRSLAGRLGSDPTIVATGGAATDLPGGLRERCVVDPWLVFRGMLVT